MKTFFHIFLLLVLPLTAQAQDITQTLRGTVYDQSTHEPLIGATVVVQNSDPVIRTTTDENGHFTLPNLRLGRVTLEVSYIGYDSRTIPEILITSASDDASVFTPDSRLKKQNGTLTLATSLTHKFSRSATFKAGIKYKQLFYKYDLSAAQDYIPSTYAHIVNSAGSTNFTEAYSQVKYQLSPSFLANVGLHIHHFGLNKEVSLESRAELAWKCKCTSNCYRGRAL